LLKTLSTQVFGSPIFQD